MRRLQSYGKSGNKDISTSLTTETRKTEKRNSKTGDETRDRPDLWPQLHTDQGPNHLRATPAAPEEQHQVREPALHVRAQTTGVRRVKGHCCLCSGAERSCLLSVSQDSGLSGSLSPCQTIGPFSAFSIIAWEDAKGTWCLEKLLSFSISTPWVSFAQTLLSTDFIWPFGKRPFVTRDDSITF